MQQLTRDNILTLISQMEYPEIRRFCLSNKNYNNICTQDPAIISICR